MQFDPTSLLVFASLLVPGVADGVTGAKTRTGGGPAAATITSGIVFNDTAGQPVHAHGAGMLLPDTHPHFGRRYYLVGTTKKLPPHWLSEGINLYSSDDLESWTFEGEILHAKQIGPKWWRPPVTADSEIRIERPKLLYNPQTAQYVMWFHLDDAAFSLGHVGVAVAETITGPYRFLAGWRPDRLRSLDMTVVQLATSEPDKPTAAADAAPATAPAAYLARSVDNRYAGFSRLTDDYLNTTSEGIFSRGPRCEGIAVWTESAPEDALYMMCSHLTGWHANPAILAIGSTGARLDANTTWRVLGNPTHKGYSYDSQPTFVLRVRVPAPPNGDGAVGEQGEKKELRMYMGDRWNEGSESAPGSVGGASYVWLPLVRNASDATGWSMPLLGGKWNGTGTWRVADYLEPR